MNFCARLGLAALLSPHHVNKLVLSLQDLATSRHWRTRAAAVGVVPALLPCCREGRTRLALGALCSSLTADSVDEVRLCAALSLARAACADELIFSEALAPVDHPVGANLAPVDDDPLGAPKWLDAVALRELTRLTAATAHRDRKLALALARELAHSCAELEQLGRSTLGTRQQVALCGCALAGCRRDAVVRAAAARLLVSEHAHDDAPTADRDQHLANRVAQTLAELTKDADPDVSACCARP